MLKPKLTKPFIISTLGSLSCHLVFAVTAGAYFLTRETPPVKNEVRVKIIEKERPDRKEMREVKVKPVVEVVPVIQPKEVVQPVTPQQVVQVASVQKVVDIQPVMMESIPTNTAPPKTARVTSHVSSKALTAAADTPRPLRSTAVATVASTGSTVLKKHSNVSVVTVPNPTPVMEPTTVPQTIVTASKTGIRQSRAVATIAHAPAPKSVSVPTTTASSRSGAVLRRSAASVAPMSGAPAPRAVTSSTSASGSGTGGVSLKRSGVQVARAQGLVPMAPAPVVEEKPKVVAPPSPEPPKVAMLAPEPKKEPEILTDPEVLEGYQSGVHRRLAFIAKKYYKRSSARRANKEGKVLIAFTLLRNGDIKNPYVKEANNHALINQAALEALKMAAPFKEFPEEIHENELQLVIPFSFTLR